MRATVMIAKVYNTTLGETRKRIIFFRDGRVFEGALFFPMDAEDLIMEIISVKYVNGTVWDVMMEAYSSMKINGMLAKDDKTLQTMLHWQHVNGFSDEIFIDAYRFKTDTAYLNYRRESQE